MLCFPPFLPHPVHSQPTGVRENKGGRDAFEGTAREDKILGIFSWAPAALALFLLMLQPVAKTALCDSCIPAD